MSQHQLHTDSQVSIFSLTNTGAKLAERVVAHLPRALHLHKPKNFIHTAQQAFSNKHRCVFICSTGIVVRALADVLVDKYQDPAVVVLDEHGKFVVPLLSGHEGGGYEFGAQLAEALGAALVQTTSTDYSKPVYCIGLGSDKDCPTETLQALYDEVVGELQLTLNVKLLASINIKAQEPCMLALTKQLQLPYHTFSASQLRTVEDQLSEKSQIVFNEVGCYGVAEAAALIGAASLTGKTAELVMTKRKNKRATLAIARSYS